MSLEVQEPIKVEKYKLFSSPIAILVIGPDDLLREKSGNDAND